MSLVPHLGLIVKGNSHFQCLYLIFVDMSLFRCETFNSYIRSQNIYGNKSSPSRDIAKKFAAIEQLRFICEGGYER